MLTKPKHPEWKAKAIWRATSVIILVNARDEEEAWNKAWKRVARTEGGDSCMEVRIIGRTDA